MIKEYKVELTVKDPLVKKVIERIAERSNVGVKKYNTNLTREDLTFDDWLLHLQEELMDASNYIEAIRNSLK